MDTTFKNIHIGELIKLRAEELNIDFSRICNFLSCTEDEIKEMYIKESLDSKILLRWSKLLEYDFFRLYSQHLILYSPPSVSSKGLKTKKLPQFRKNIYTQEVIDFILELLKTGEKTKSQIMEDYEIPKTTLYKWISKYSNESVKISSNYA